jgi:hypothetical protein
VIVMILPDRLRSILTSPAAMATDIRSGRNDSRWKTKASGSPTIAANDFNCGSPARLGAIASEGWDDVGVSARTCAGALGGAATTAPTRSATPVRQLCLWSLFMEVPSLTTAGKA